MKPLSKSKCEVMATESRSKIPSREGMSIVLGSCHQGDISYLPHSGRQCVANAVTFLCYTEGKMVENMRCDDIDKVLDNGNTFYSMIHDHVQSNYLHTDDLPRSFIIDNIRYEINMNDSRNGFITEDNEILENLSWAFNGKSNVLFICAEKFISLKYYNGHYYIFDAHSNSVEGLPSPYGKACVMKFKSFGNMCSHLKKCSTRIHLNCLKLHHV